MRKLTDDDLIDLAEKHDSDRAHDDYFNGPIFTATFWKLVGGVLLGLGLAVGVIYLLLG